MCGFACVFVCVFAGVCISDQTGEYSSILHLDEEINISDVMPDEKSS